jgi:hypothetical protein
MFLKDLKNRERKNGKIFVYNLYAMFRCVFVYNLYAMSYI